MAGNRPGEFFGYVPNRGQDDEISTRLGSIEKALGITSGQTEQGLGGIPAKEKKKGSALGGAFRILQQQGKGAVTAIDESEKYSRQSADELANYLESQITSGRKSPTEAADMFAEFTTAYNIPGGYKTAEQLGGLTMGTAPEADVARYRPFQQFAARQLGLSLSEDQIKSTESAARALGKTSPEAFTQFLGQTMMSSPEYIRKTPLAFAANLPYGGKYGVGYQTPQGTFTGTYRFRPPNLI